MTGLSDSSTPPPPPPPDFICPDCRGALGSAAGNDGAPARRCAGCGRAWPVVDDVPDFTGEDIYWGEFERATAERLVAAARKQGWRAAAETVLAPRPELVEYIQNERRANALSLVPFARRGRLLDVGAGWGAITTAASRLFDRVYSIEAVRLRAQFTRLRLAGEGRPNVTLAQASLFALPFAENFFDVILLNGILEWIGDWNRSRPPRAAQRDLLLALARFLRPGGMLLVGIENRIGYRYLLGRRDHNNLWGTNLLPRPLASVVQRLRQGAPYRVYTYGMPGLRRLLRDGGFGRAEFFAPMPGYNIPNTLVPLEGRGRLAFQLTQRVSRHTLKRRVAVRAATWLERAGALRHIPADFLVAAHRSEDDAAAGPATLWDEVRGALGKALPEPVRRAAARDVIVNAEHNPGRPVLIVLDAAGRRPLAFVKTATPEFAPLLRAENAVLARLATNQRVEDGARIFPLSHGLMDASRGVALALEALDGTPLYHLMKQPGTGHAAGEKYLRAAIELALTLDRRVMAGEAPPEAEAAGDVWREAVREAAPLLPPGGAERIAALIGGVRARRFQHGDFFAKNIIVREGRPADATELRLVDWADAGFHLTPLFDTVFYLATGWTELGDVVPGEARVTHARGAFRGDGLLAKTWRAAWERGKADWTLGDEWTPDDVVILALAVYRRRIAAIKGPAHPEPQGIEACLRALAKEQR